VALIKNAGEKMEQKIYNLIRKIWNDEQMPMDWEERIKGKKVKVSRYRPEQALGGSGRLRLRIFMTFGTRRW
jgi:hypothetical protein